MWALCQSGHRRWLKTLALREGSQLVEFAVALPLLVVIVVGIFDFGQAFNLKQRLNSAAREGARLASAIPTNDLSASGTPVTIKSIHALVDGYLQDSGINDCGLASTTPTVTSTLTWTYTASGSSCPAPLTLTIERGYAYLAPIPGGTGNEFVIASRVTLSYPYQWRFSSVIQLIAPGATYAGTTLITTDATVTND